MVKSSQTFAKMHLRKGEKGVENDEVSTYSGNLIGFGIKYE